MKTNQIKAQQIVKKLLEGKTGYLLIGVLAHLHSAYGDTSFCKEEDYVSMKGDVKVELVGMDYTPRCLKVIAGSQVTLPGSKRHPISAMPDQNGVANPFGQNSASTSDVTRTLGQVGDYGYYCIKHGDSSGSGMAGAIRVVESF